MVETVPWGSPRASARAAAAQELTCVPSILPTSWESSTSWRDRLSSLNELGIRGWGGRHCQIGYVLQLRAALS